MVECYEEMYDEGVNYSHAIRLKKCIISLPVLILLQSRNM